MPVNEPLPLASAKVCFGTSAFAVSFAEIVVEAVGAAVAALPTPMLAIASAAIAATSLVDFMARPFRGV